MRVMVIVKATADSEAGRMPDASLLEAMGAFNEQLAAAGVIVEAAGLKPTSKGARVHFRADGRAVEHGPFERTSDLTAGFWIWEVRDLDEALEWARRCPHPHPGVETHIEIRPFYEEADFG